MQGTERFEVASFLGTWNDKKFFKVQCKESFEFFTMEVVSKRSIADPNWMQFGTVADSLPNWGLPFCMELRFVFESPHKRYYVLDCAGEASLADLMNDGLPEPTVLVIAAELGLALEGLHELGVSYNELDLGHVAVDSNGHVVLWREFEGKEYWHISECICGVLGGNCEKIGHKVKRRGTNVPPGQKHWEEIFRRVQDDWKSLGVLLCQLLTGQVDFQNFQSLEEAIISLFITPNTKDFLYGLVSGALQSFEDLKCHPCFDGLDWDEVKSKSLPSPLMASFRSRLHSAPSRRVQKSPSLQNVYTAGISARQERGVFTKSKLSRTHSTSDLHSYSLGDARPNLSAFKRASSERRSTLAVPYSGSDPTRPDKERLGRMDNGTTAKQDTRNLAYSQHARAKSALNLHRKVFEQNSRSFDDRPPCLSAPSSPRHSVDTAQSYVFPPHNSAPSSPQGSANAIHSDNHPNSQPTTTNGVFNHPETNPFHEGYKKRWGSVTIDTAYGIYSSHLKRTNDSNNNGTIPGSTGEMVDTNQLKNNSACGIYYRDLKDNAYGATSCYGPVVSNQPNTYAIANAIYSPALRQNDNSIIPDTSGMFINSGQRSAYSTELTQQGSRTRHYSVDVSSDSNGVYYNPRNSPNNTSPSQSYFQPNDSPITAMQEQSQEKMVIGNFETCSGIYVPNSQISPGNINNMNCLERSFSLQKISDQQLQEHLPERRRVSIDLDKTDELESLRSQNPTNHALSVHSNGSSHPTATSSFQNNEQFQKRKGSINLETSDGIHSSFFQTSSNNQKLSTEQNTSKETANILFQKYFQSRRGGVDSEISGKVSPRNSEVNLTRTFIDGSSQAPQRQTPSTFREQSYVRQNNQTLANSPVSRVTNVVLPTEQLSNEYIEANYGQAQFRRGVENYSSLRSVSKDELKTNVNQSVQIREANNASPKRIQERTVSPNSSVIYSSNLLTTTNNLGPPNTSFKRRNSRSPEPIVVIHPSISPHYNPTPNSGEVSIILPSDADEINRFQEESQRRRSSTDVGSLGSLPISANKSETPSPKKSLSRSVSYSNVSEGFRNAMNDRTNAVQGSHRRSTTLKPIPSFEEFRTMRALSKMAYGESNDSEATQKDAGNSCGSKDKNVHYSEGGHTTVKNNNSNNNNSSSSNNSNDNNNNNNNNNTADTTTKSPKNNPVIQDLLVKYGLDKSPRTSTLNLCQNSSNRADSRENNTATPPHDSLRTTTSDPTDTKQRLLNILDDFLAIRTKQKTLSTSSSMYNLKGLNSLRDQRRPSLPSDPFEENRSKNPNDRSVVENKDLDLKVARSSPKEEDLDLKVASGSPKEKASSVCAHNKPEKFSSPTLLISSPKSADSFENRNYKDINTSTESKAQTVSKGKKNCSEHSRRRNKKINNGQKYIPESQQSENRATSPDELKAKVSLEESNTGINQSDESMVSLTSEVKPGEHEGLRRVSEKARNMARKHRESLELVKKSGKKARKGRRKSFTQALQNKTKGSTSEQEEYINQENDDTQPVGKSGPMKGDHSFEIESASVEQGDLKYQKVMNRRTSSLLSLTDDFSGDLDEFGVEDVFPNRSESLSEFNEEEGNPDEAISREDSFLSVDTDFPRRRNAFRTESSSSLLSRGSSFHSNFSADSGSVQLDFDDSDVDDDLFYSSEPLETAQKSETEIQRNDSGLGDEIGVATRAKKRWQDLGHVTSRQSMIVASWRELGARKDDKVQEGQGIEMDKQGLQNENGQQKQGRKVSRERRISRERQPNAIDCPDCGRAFLVENDKPCVTSQGPKQALICYKCQSHRVERKEAIVELVQTEINYGNDFQIIKEEFLSPMQTGGIVSPENLAKIFLNIQELLDVSTKFCKKIQNSMEKCMNKNDEELCHMNVGKVFVENVELLQAYELYCSRQPEAMSLLESLQKKNDVLRVFLNITCRENLKCRKMDINSFLMAPVQRVTKYPLLLSRIRRATPRWHEDREDLKLAQRKVEEQIAKINSLTKSSEMKAKKFQGNLGASDSVDSSRLKKLASDVLTWTLDEMQLLMHGQLKVLCSEFGGGQSWTKRAVKRSMETHLLFCIRGQNEPIKVDSEEDDSLQFPNVAEISDASLLLLKRKSNGKYTLFRDEVKLRDCVIYEEAEPDSFGIIHMGKESFLFTARTSKDARKWIKYLKLQTKNQGKWRRRRNASANIMLKTS